MENQGIYSEVYVDQIFRTGAAFLLTDDIQIEGSIGANTKDSPSLFSMNAGISYRLDFHKDKDKAGIQSEKDREKAMKIVDARLLKSYEKLRDNARNGLAVVMVKRGACGGCFSSVPPQRQTDIKDKKKIIVCEHCGRILVPQEASEA